VFCSGQMVFIIHCFLLDWYFTTLGDPEGRNTWLMQLCSVTMPIQLLLGQIDHVPTVAFFFFFLSSGPCWTDRFKFAH
jgi:hypothetical protein